MANPRRRHSKTRGAWRLAPIYRRISTPKGFISCANCHEATLPHRVCPDCGFYNGKQVVENKDSEK